MKKFFSISIVFLMIIAMLHLTIAAHYCCGHLAAFRISLDGKLASCGMEGCNDIEFPDSGTHLFSDCCYNTTIIDATDNYYTSTIFFESKPFQFNLLFFITPLGIQINVANLTSFSTNVSPYKILMVTVVDLSNICVFRI